MSYGATDQQTARELAGSYDGLLVPGTVAAFQRDGTQGFVLSLSAGRHTPYVIDPRTPLFQNALATPKKSHTALATLLGIPSTLFGGTPPLPSFFDDQVLANMLRSWVSFNTNYSTIQHRKLDKYAKRLGETLETSAAIGPDAILVPYFIASSTSDPWWEVSTRLWRLAQEFGGQTELVRVVATSDSDQLGAMLAQAETTNAVVWVSPLDELDLNSEYKLKTYAETVNSHSALGKSAFALYGGYFAVMMTKTGLGGFSHGIGFGESRDWIELPQSGPPPARYYVPRLHRYVGVDLADIWWETDRDLVACPCVECLDTRPSLLSYHSLMKHSVHCRHAEFQTARDGSLSDMLDALEQAALDFREWVESASVPRAIKNRTGNSIGHLTMWARALRPLA